MTEVVRTARIRDDRVDGNLFTRILNPGEVPPMALNSEPYIGGVNGHQVSIANPSFADWSIGEIAVGLANECRFAGQIKRHYSVAAHSLLVLYLYLRDAGDSVDEELALALLIHDAHEAVIKDIPTPLKRGLPDYQKLEQRFERAMWARFNMLEAMPLMAGIIKRYDTGALLLERDYFAVDPYGTDWPNQLRHPMDNRTVDILRTPSYAAAASWAQTVRRYYPGAGC